MMTPLIETLLAYTDKYGGKVCRMGAVQTVIPVLPPGMTVTFEIRPYFNAYMNIEFWISGSPAIVPGTINWQSHQRGYELQLQLVNALTIRDGVQVWIEYTNADPIMTTIQNVSPLNQYVETLDFFLIVDKKENLTIVRDIIAKYQGVNQGVK